MLSTYRYRKQNYRDIAMSRPIVTPLLKTLWEKEKLLVTSNFSFSDSVFHWFG